MTAYSATVAAGGSVPTGTGVETVLITGTPSALSTSTLYAVLLRGDGINLSGTALTTQEIVSSGATSAGNTISVTTPSFGSTDGVIIDTANSTLNLSTALTTATSGGLTIGGAGTLILSVANANTGTVNLLSGTLNSAPRQRPSAPPRAPLLRSAAPSPRATVSLANAVQLNPGPGYVTLTGANNITFNGSVISGAGSIAFNMANPTVTVTYTTSAAANSYTGLTNVINGILSLGATGSDRAWSVNGLLVIGNGQTGTAAVVLDNSNNVPNQTIMIVNNTGAFVQQTGGDALGGIILNGGNVQLAGTNGNLEDAIVALPSAVPSAITMVSGGSTGFARTAVGAGYNVLNVFPGAGPAAGNELTLSGAFTPGSSGSGFTVTKVGMGNVTFAGSTANTFSEPTIVNEGSLLLAKSAAAIAGPLVVGNFNNTDSVRVLSNTNQLNGQQVTVNALGTVNAAPGGSIYQINLTAATGGTFNIGVSTTAGSQTTTANLPFNATPAQILAALQTLTTAIPNGATDVQVYVSGTLPTTTTGGVYNVSFTGNLANQNTTLSIASSLTGTATTTLVYAGTSPVAGTTGTLDLRGGTLSIGASNLSIGGTVQGRLQRRHDKPDRQQLQPDRAGRPERRRRIGHDGDDHDHDAAWLSDWPKGQRQRRRRRGLQRRLHDHGDSVADQLHLHGGIWLDDARGRRRRARHQRRDHGNRRDRIGHDGHDHDNDASRIAKRPNRFDRRPRRVRLQRHLHDHGDRVDDLYLHGAG